MSTKEERIKYLLSKSWKDLTEEEKEEFKKIIVFQIQPLSIKDIK